MLGSGYTSCMIRHIVGKVAHQSINSIVVDVRGVGYLVFVNQPSQFSLDTDVKLHTHHAIRETTSDLYGFTTLDELELFELLLGLQGIGPKSAAQILTQADLTLIKTAINNDDPAHLSKMSGMGKKTAEKVVLGLKDKVADLGWGTTDSDGLGSEKTTDWQSDAIDALISLGYPQSDARKTVQNLSPEINSANDAIKAALKELGQN